MIWNTKEITADIGKRLEFDNGSVVFIPGHFNDGECYKDEGAFETGKGICYIREAEFDNECGLVVLNEEQIQCPPEDICNRQQFIDLCTTVVERYKKDGFSFGNEAEEEGFIQDLAKLLFYTVEWAGIDMYIDEWDLTELYEEYIDNKR